MAKDSRFSKSGIMRAHSEVVYTPSVCGAFLMMKLPGPTLAGEGMKSWHLDNDV